MNTPVVRNTRKSTPTPTPLISYPIGFGPGGPLPAPTPWVNYGSWIVYGGGVVVGNPDGGSFGPGTINVGAYYLNGIPFDLTDFLLLTGGTVAGPLTVQGPFVVQSTVDGIALDMGTY